MGGFFGALGALAHGGDVVSVVTGAVAGAIVGAATSFISPIPGAGLLPFLANLGIAGAGGAAADLVGDAAGDVASDAIADWGETLREIEHWCLKEWSWNRVGIDAASGFGNGALAGAFGAASNTLGGTILGGFTGGLTDLVHQAVTKDSQP